MADVSAAREMVVAQADAAIENAAVKEEDDFLQRLMNKFSGPEPQEVSLEHIQKTLRRSRKEGARSPAELIKAGGAQFIAEPHPHALRADERAPAQSHPHPATA